MSAAVFPPVLPGVIGGALTRTVNGRDLHAFLQVGRDFTNWIKGRIATYGFVENTDYVKVDDLSSPNSANSSSHGGARPQRTTEYHLTVDMAKELSMVENNDQGRAARRYFIECERRAKAAEAALSRPAQVDLPALPAAGTRAQLVAECRRIYGARAAHELWDKLVLPDVWSSPRPKVPVLNLFGDTRDTWCQRVVGALMVANEGLDEQKLAIRAKLSTSELNSIIARLEADGIIQPFCVKSRRFYRISDFLT